jgi:hypothetical protein
MGGQVACQMETNLSYPVWYGISIGSGPIFLHICLTLYQRALEPHEPSHYALQGADLLSVIAWCLYPPRLYSPWKLPHRGICILFDHTCTVCIEPSSTIWMNTCHLIPSIWIMLTCFSGILSSAWSHSWTSYAVRRGLAGSKVQTTVLSRSAISRTWNWTTKYRQKHCNHKTTNTTLVVRLSVKTRSATSTFVN